jgi:hypothetical protein
MIQPVEFTMNKLNAVYNLKVFHFNNRFNITPKHTPWCLTLFHLLVYSDQITVAIDLAYFILLNVVTLTTYGDGYKLLMPL